MRVCTAHTYKARVMDVIISGNHIRQYCESDGRGQAKMKLTVMPITSLTIRRGSELGWRAQRAKWGECRISNDLPSWLGSHVAVSGQRNVLMYVQGHGDVCKHTQQSASAADADQVCRNRRIGLTSDPPP